jgi:NAD(P)-dependent dehydrogenase (short-subunit alcohol dehydrogenase family)
MESAVTPIIDYSGKTVVITGAATGVGAELVTLLRGAGPERIIAVDIKACDGPVDDTIITDLADPEAIDDMILRLPAIVDTLFYNAGVAATLPPEVVMAVNVLAPRKLITAASDRMPPGGAVVITASAAGNRYVDHLAEIQELLAISDWHEALAWVRDRTVFAEEPYGFSKECAQVLTLQWAPMLLRRGIRLNSVCPGLIDTPLFSDFVATMGQPILDWMVSQSGGRRAAPAEVANVLAFIGSDAASYISGSNIIADYGFTAAVLTNQIDYSTLPSVPGLT